MGRETPGKGREKVTEGRGRRSVGREGHYRRHYQCGTLSLVFEKNALENARYALENVKYESENQKFALRNPNPQPGNLIPKSGNLIPKRGNLTPKPELAVLKQRKSNPKPEKQLPGLGNAEFTSENPEAAAGIAAPRFEESRLPRSHPATNASSA